MALIRNICTLFFIIFLVISTIVVMRTISLNTAHRDLPECKKSDFDFIPASEKVVERFRTALRFQTIAREKNDYNRDELRQLVDYIMTAYPELHASKLVQHEIVANYSLLYTIRGSNPDLTPYLFMAHLDVVPADAAKWDVPPFSADIKDGFIYARGTIDDKHAVMGMLEALNFYISQNKQPERGFYVAFGHDEEVSGAHGAGAISELLWSRGVRDLLFILDEGLTIINDIIPGMADPVALIGTSEKGQAYLELKVEGTPGHSSMPPPESTIGILANAIARLERYPQPSMMGYGPEKDTFEHLAPYMKLPHRVVMSNLWLFKPIVSWVMSKKTSTNAIVRTVTAVTMFNAGIKEVFACFVVGMIRPMFNAGIKINVNAPEAKAYVNHRIHPAQTVEQVLEYDRAIINDERVKLRVLYEMESHPIAGVADDDFGYQTIKSSIRQIWNGTYVAPGTMIGNTDTRHYLKYTKNVYRFSPTIMFPEDLARFHGDNERISIQNFEQAINFYYHVILNSNKGSLEPAHKHGEL